MPSPSAGDLLALIEARDRDGLIDLVAEVTAASGLDALVALLGEVQREVGERWQHQRWSVADEHAATAMVELALAAAALEVRDADGGVGAVVVTCAEEDWHVLPARMLAEQLRARGWRVTFLGGSTPADHLSGFLTQDAPVAVAVSCSLPIYLGGARRSVLAAHEAGVPAIVGGAAFGRSRRRAEAIGADGWAASADEAHTLLSTWGESPPPFADPADDAAQPLLASERHELVASAMAALARDFPPFAQFSQWQRTKTREDFDYILRFVEAALLTGDDNIVLDFAEWLTRLLAARALPRDIVGLSIRSLLSCLPPGHSARRLLDLAAAAADRSGGEA